MINFNGAAALETPEFMLAHIDELGGPDSYNHYAVGWAHAMDTPYQWAKQVASHFGGTRNGTIVHWPAGFEARDEIRTQLSHVIDVAPTVLDAAGLTEPTCVHGIQQTPMQGVSMRYSFAGNPVNVCSARAHARASRPQAVQRPGGRPSPRPAGRGRARCGSAASTRSSQDTSAGRPRW
jgi:arylsulfatase A-like enzyme